METLRRLASGIFGRGSPDGLAARHLEISSALPATPCVHGVAGAWLRPQTCPDCRAVIEASHVAARTRAAALREAAEGRSRSALEARFVREIREELRLREAVRPTRPARGPVGGQAGGTRP